MTARYTEPASLLHAVLIPSSVLGFTLVLLAIMHQKARFDTQGV
jgi:hypothetical protein